MKFIFLSVFLLLITSPVIGQLNKPDQVSTDNGTLTIMPIMHASIVMSWNNKTIYIDPAGNPDLFKGIPAPDIILITDIHGDHLDKKVLQAINTSKATIIAPQAVADSLSMFDKDRIIVLRNGDKTNQAGIDITALPMYNLPDAADSRHPKGRGNGYLVIIGGKNIYISGDTEDTKEMRALKDIDIAFVCMNLPYTMDINQAASAVLEFKPAVVYPYHHRGQDIIAFRKLVTDSNKQIDVRLRDWYPN